jgi:F0F1-type ATP synthase membrane subunit b/b'
MDSLNGLDRLLEAETMAAALIQDAEAKAGLIVGQARDEAHAREKERLTRLHAEQESELASFKSEIAEKLKNELDEYEKSLVAAHPDERLFATTCGRFMSSEA